MDEPLLSNYLPGLDWSEDSADDDIEKEEEESLAPFQISWRPQNRFVY